MITIPADEDGMPDLQMLVRQVGGYGKITVEMWQAYESAMVRALSAHRFGDKYARGKKDGVSS